MLALLRIAFRNVLVHRERLLLLLLVVGGSSALLTFVSALGAGAAAAHRRAITTLISGEVSVGAFFKVHPDAIAPVIADTGPVSELAAPLLPPGCELRTRGRGYATLWAGKRRGGSFLISIEPGKEPELAAMLAPEQGDLSALSEPNTVAISTRMADRLQVGVGDLISLYVTNARGSRNGLDARVVAITPSVGLLGDAAGVVVGNPVVRELFSYKPAAASSVQVHCRERIDAEALASALRRRMREAGLPLLPVEHKAWADKVAPLLREGWRGQRYDVTTWSDEGVFLEFVSEGLGALTLLLGGIVIFVVVIGIFISLSVAVRERTREIGTLRAMGMRRSSVVALFVFEGLLMGALASTLGGLLATVACVVLKGQVPIPEAASTLLLDNALPLEVHPLRSLAVVAIVTIGAALASVLPALRAASFQPRRAMETVL